MSSQSSQSRQENERENTKAYHKFYYDAFKSLPKETKKNIIKKAQEGLIKNWQIQIPKMMEKKYSKMIMPKFFLHYRPYSIEEANAILSSEKVTLNPIYAFADKMALDAESQIEQHENVYRHAFVAITTNYYKYLNNLHKGIYDKIHKEASDGEKSHIPKPFDMENVILDRDKKSKDIKVKDLKAEASKPKVYDHSVDWGALFAGGKRKSRKSSKSNKRRTHKR
jgi:hypothetical protein